MADRFTVLTVCTGNIHRSALADELLATWANWYLPSELRESVVIGSAGSGAPIGQRMGGSTRRIAASLGAVDRGHRSRALSDDLIDDADLILVASRAHRDEVLSRVPRAMRRTFTIREAGRIARLLPAGHPGSLADLSSVVTTMADRRAEAVPMSPSDDDVVDPHRQGPEAVDAMAREEVPALAELAVALLGMPRADADEYARFVVNLSSPR